MVGHVFVTVGTTKFEKLIETVASEKILGILEKLGYKSIQFQTGTGTHHKTHHSTLKLEYNTYFPNFPQEIIKADLVISHAGAGTCLEVLQQHKRLIVVINDELMNNHQTELATELSEGGYLYCCTCDTLPITLQKDLNFLKPYPTPQPQLFSNFLDKCMGFID